MARLVHFVNLRALLLQSVTDPASFSALDTNKPNLRKLCQTFNKAVQPLNWNSVCQHKILAMLKRSVEKIKLM